MWPHFRSSRVIGIQRRRHFKMISPRNKLCATLFLWTTHWKQRILYPSTIYNLIALPYLKIYSSCASICFKVIRLEFSVFLRRKVSQSPSVYFHFKVQLILSEAPLLQAGLAQTWHLQTRVKCLDYSLALMFESSLIDRPYRPYLHCLVTDESGVNTFDDVDSDGYHF